MRIDHVLGTHNAVGPEETKTPSVIATAVSANKFGSDHWAVLYQVASGLDKIAAPWPKGAIKVDDSHTSGVNAISTHGEQDLDIPRKSCADHRNSAAIVENMAEARHQLREAMNTAQQQKQQLPAFDAAAWMESWEQLGNSFSSVAAVNSVQFDEMIEEDSYSAYSDGRLSKPCSENMPEVNIKVKTGNRTRRTRALVDSGSFFNLMTETEATRLGLEIVRREDTTLKLPTLMAADYGRMSVVGLAKAKMVFDHDRLLVEFFIMKRCPHDTILGSDFLRKRKGYIDFEDMQVVFKASSQMVHIPFKSVDLKQQKTTICAVATEKCIIKPGEYGTLPVTLPAIENTGCAKWGLLKKS